MDEMLRAFKGTVQCDGYGAYTSYAKSKADIELACCWAHIDTLLLVLLQDPEFVPPATWSTGGGFSAADGPSNIGDGVGEACDNCTAARNPGQANGDSDTAGSG